MAAAVTNRLSSDAGSSHFQAKPISWSIRTRGSVPRIQTKVNTKTYVLPRNQSRPATQSSPMYAPAPTSADDEQVDQDEADDERLPAP